MTEDEWVQQALSDLPPMSDAKRSRLRSIFRDKPAVAEVKPSGGITHEQWMLVRKLYRLH